MIQNAWTDSGGGRRACRRGSGGHRRDCGDDVGEGSLAQSVGVRRVGECRDRRGGDAGGAGLADQASDLALVAVEAVGGDRVGEGIEVGGGEVGDRSHALTVRIIEQYEKR
jgi:hypothetical protein